MIRSLAFLLLIASASVVPPALAANPPTIDDVHALDAKCEAARTAQLEPLRAQKTAQCVARGQRSEDDCRTYYSTYGDNSSRARGGTVRGQFYDLSECRAARRALNQMQAAQNQ